MDRESIENITINKMLDMVKLRDYALDALINKLIDMKKECRGETNISLDSDLKKCYEMLTTIDCRQAQIITLSELCKEIEKNENK